MNTINGPQKTRKNTEKDLIYEKESFALRGAFFEVFSTVGCGFLEAVYQETLATEFQIFGIPFQEQAELKLQYKGLPLKQTYKPDFVCFDKIIVEIKSVYELAPEHEAQLLNYLRITKMRLGFLVNFGHYPKVEIRRFAL